MSSINVKLEILQGWRDMSIQTFRLPPLFSLKFRPFSPAYRRISTAMHLPPFPVPPSVPLNHTSCSHGPACTMQVKQSTGPLLIFQLKPVFRHNNRIRARVLTSKLLHFVSSTDSFIMIDAKLLKPVPCS